MTTLRGVPAVDGGLDTAAPAADRAGAPPSRAAFAAAARLLRDASDVTLLAHVNPDADALGSALALGTALCREGAAVRVAFGAPDTVPESLRDLDTHGLVVAAADVPATCDLLVALDAGSVERLGPLASRLAGARRVLVIDHHASNTRFGTDHLVDPTAEATAVLVLRLLDELGLPVDTGIARCLYAGIVTDTRCFRVARPETHLMAARLLATGVEPEAATRPLLDTHPFDWLGMLSAVLRRARLEPAEAGGLGLVHTAVHASDAARMRPEEVESVIDVVRTAAEAEVAAVLKQVGPRGWTVSLRAKDRVDVGHAATTLGGGGHRLAAGYSATGDVDDVLVALRAALATAPRM